MIFVNVLKILKIIMSLSEVHKTASVIHQVFRYVMAKAGVSDILKIV